MLVLDYRICTQKKEKDKDTNVYSRGTSKVVFSDALFYSGFFLPSDQIQI